MDNAFLAFERAAMLPEAIKNPLIYLNFAIHCYETGRIEQAQLNLGNFAKMTEETKVRVEVAGMYEVVVVAFLNFFFCFFQIGKASQKLSAALAEYDKMADERLENEDFNVDDLDDGTDRNDEEEEFKENLV